VSRNQKEISRARRIQDDYALSERRYAKSRAKGRAVGRKSDEARGRQWMEKEKQRGASSHTKNVGRIEGFLAGSFFTAVAWLWTTRKSWMGA
jgi:hypothetical protein